MSNHVLLNNVDHGDLKIITDRSAAYGDNVICTGVFAFEFRRLQQDYPIVFRHDRQADIFEPAALLGFKDKENLFLTEQGWDADYIPLSIERQPFLIGFHNAGTSNTQQRDMVVHIDMDHPRVNRDKGEMVFMPHGGNSPYLQRICSVLDAIHQGNEYNKGFSAVLQRLELLEPFTLKMELDDYSKHELAGFHTINEERFKKLSDKQLGELHRSGYLEHIYTAMASLPNLVSLIDRKNRKSGHNSLTDAT